MKKHIPNLITSLNLLSGALGCIEVLQGDYQTAIYFVLVAGLFDFFDGFAARLLKVQSAIGKELDSLADMVSFGLLPALYMFMQIKSSNPTPAWLAFTGLIIAAFSAIRLAKFNIDTRQSTQFIGVPTPANAIMLTSMALLPDSINLSTYWLVAIGLIASFMLVMNVPMIALKFSGTGWSKNKWKYSLIIIIGILVGIFQISAIPFVIPIYILFSLLGNFSSKKQV